MFRLIAIANLLLISMAYKIRPIIKNGVIPDDVSTSPFVKIANGYYYIETKLSKNWFGAYKSCRLIGSELVSFDTIDEWRAVIQYLEEMDNTLRLYWTSGTDLPGENGHIWFSNGQSISLDIWYNGEPNNKNNEEHCDALTTWPNNTWPTRLNDDGCQKLYNFICKAPQPKTASFIIW